MYIFLPIFLLTTFLPFTLTAPSIFSPRTTCFASRSRIPPNPYDCIDLLDVLRTNPYVSEQVTYGDDEPFPGHTPIYKDERSCHLVVESVRLGKAETERFVLARYFPALYQVVQQCFLASERGFVVGVVRVGEEGKFLAYLGAFEDTVRGGGGNRTRLGVEGRRGAVEGIGIS